MMPYAPVLERVVDLVTQDPTLKYGDALDQAMQALGVCVPQAVQDAILTAAFRISLTGFPTSVKA
jgi:hypothetical protein